jgi:hypothetical protein
MAEDSRGQGPGVRRKRKVTGEYIGGKRHSHGSLKYCLAPPALMLAGTESRPTGYYRVKSIIDKIRLKSRAYPTLT